MGGCIDYIPHLSYNILTMLDLSGNVTILQTYSFDLSQVTLNNTLLIQGGIKYEYCKRHKVRRRQQHLCLETSTGRFQYIFSVDCSRITGSRLLFEWSANGSVWLGKIHPPNSKYTSAEPNQKHPHRWRFPISLRGLFCQQSRANGNPLGN